VIGIKADEICVLIQINLQYKQGHSKSSLVFHLRQETSKIRGKWHLARIQRRLKSKAKCRQFEENNCNRCSYSNFMHVKKINKDLHRNLSDYFWGSEVVGAETEAEVWVLWKRSRSIKISMERFVHPSIEKWRIFFVMIWCWTWVNIERLLVILKSCMHIRQVYAHILRIFF